MRYLLLPNPLYEDTSLMIFQSLITRIKTCSIRLMMRRKGDKSEGVFLSSFLSHDDDDCEEE